MDKKKEEPKKILFLVGNLESGGVSKSMVNLLQVIDKRQYEISLWVGKTGGLYEGLLPKEGVRVIADSVTDALNRGPKGIMLLLLRGRFIRAFLSGCRMFLSLFSKPMAALLLSRLYPVLKEEYDVIVDYGGQQLLYFMVDRLHARKKISFFHSDYKKWPYYFSLDRYYYPKVDGICTISTQCVKSFIDLFPVVEDKMHCIENISSVSMIRRMADVYVEEVPNDVPVFVTVGHVSEAKGSDLAIRAAAMIEKQGIDFVWVFVGKVSDPKRYESMIKDYGLGEKIRLLGIRQNPYPYMKRATLVVHPSQFEGKSIALDEAKILCKPIVVTNFSTVRDQFEDGVNASICEMTLESLSRAIVDLLNNPSRRLRYSKWLEEHVRDNSSEVRKLYDLFG